MTFQIPGDGGGAGITETELGQLNEYYQMCRRYGIDFFEENPGNTVYHLLLKNHSLLFTFCRRKNQYSIRYLIFGRKQMEEAWLNILDYVKQIHRETGRNRGRVTQKEACFTRNLELLEKDVNRSLRPFSFIVSVLPEECFPKAKHVRLYNHFHMEEAHPEEIMVPLHAGDAEAKTFTEYTKMRNTLLRESRAVKTAEWELAQTTGNAKLSRRKSTVSVRQTGRPDSMCMSDIEAAFSRLWEK